MSYTRTSCVVIAVLALAAGLAACGSGTSDKSQITSVVKAIDSNPKNFCNPKYVTSKFIANQVQQGCPWNSVHPWQVAINSMKINGNTATLKVLDALGPPDPGSSPDPGELDLVKQGGVWKVDSGGASNAIG